MFIYCGCQSKGHSNNYTIGELVYRGEKFAPKPELIALIKNWCYPEKFNEKNLFVQTLENLGMALLITYKSNQKFNSLKCQSIFGMFACNEYYRRYFSSPFTKVMKISKNRFEVWMSVVNKKLYFIKNIGAGIIFLFF